ncbi:hypothetical protein Salat_0234100 [Sesamum alatum]|uniref:Uncharacterized protein n=1 Tax=Sesamum alatum TaxID=300844 RepID=A0AAE2CYE6_9LAMI|nr:hypothetical protein Salat_0234100 [Sesamum alatum]
MLPQVWARLVLQTCSKNNIARCCHKVFERKDSNVMLNFEEFNMDSNSLSPLTRTTHTNSRSTHVPNPYDGGNDDKLEEEVGNEYFSRVRKEFNFMKFYKLASRVLDKDDSFMEALASLQEH